MIGLEVVRHWKSLRFRLLQALSGSFCLFKLSQALQALASFIRFQTFLHNHKTSPLSKIQQVTEHPNLPAQEFLLTFRVSQVDEALLYQIETLAVEFSN